MSETEAEIARIATLIQELGYRAQISGETISTAMSGWSVLVIVWPGHSIQMYFGISVDAEDGFGLEQANEFNRTHRFAKCYILEDSARFEGDFYFDVTQPDAKEKLDRIFLSWEISIGGARDALNEAKRLHDKRVAAPTPPN
jgi:hypothetical protein